LDGTNCFKSDFSIISFDGIRLAIPKVNKNAAQKHVLKGSGRSLSGETTMGGRRVPY